MLAARPNAAHRALVELEGLHQERGGQFLLVTQNIDTLHEDAGSRRLIKVHGSADRVRCSREGCRHGAPHGSLPRAALDLAPLRATPAVERLPRCPDCGALLRQHVLWFDEYYAEHEDYGWERVVDAAESSAATLFVGTSFAVGVTDLTLRGALQRGVPAAAIDPNLPSHLPSRLQPIRSLAEVVLPRLVERLRAGA